MALQVKTEQSTIVIQLNGKIDEKGAEEIKKTFISLPLENIKEVHLDLHQLNYIGSSGIGKILLLYKNLGVKGIRLRLSGVPSHIFELFKELKLDTIFPIEAG